MIRSFYVNVIAISMAACILVAWGLVSPNTCMAKDEKTVSQTPAAGQGDEQNKPSESVQQEDSDQSSLNMLNSINKLRTGLKERIAEKTKNLAKSESDAEKESLNYELQKLDKQSNEYNLDFERIATGIDVGLFAEKKEEVFDWKQEVLSLVEPGIKEIKRLTVKARYKTKLKDERSYFQDLSPVATQAVENINQLIEKTDDAKLKKDLKKILPEWQAVEKQIQNKLEIVSMQLGEMEKEEKSFFETSQTSAKNFVRTRGLFLIIAVTACLGMIFILRLLSKTFTRFIPGYSAKYRPFHVRVMSLASRVLTVFITLFVLILVFYMFEDWVLLSLTIIFIMGLGWTAKTALPQYWQQSRLMLNIGSVKEGERVTLYGVPWLVKEINLFSRLENPSLGVELRLPIEDLFGKNSRTFHPKEPWFPCKRNDWVILADGTRGVVTSLTHEMVEMVQRGGSHKTYQTSDFLGLTPLNISVNFRLKNTFGIGYDHQKESTTSILEKMKTFIEQQIEKEGYEDSLLNLRVEFQTAGASSLDLVIITDFKGKDAPLYQRLNRAVQRWCVDACSEYNWDIPFPQMTIHKAN